VAFVEFNIFPEFNISALFFRLVINGLGFVMIFETGLEFKTMPLNSPVPDTDILDHMRGRQMLSRVILCCAALGTVVTPPMAHGIGLGEVVTHSGIGELFKAEIPLKLSAGEQVDISCISFAPPPPNDMSDVPWVSNGKLSIRQSESGLVLQIVARPVNHPAVMLGILVRCGISLRRDYALLLDPPGTPSAGIAIEPVIKASSDATKIEVAKERAKPLLPKNRIGTVEQSENLESVSKKLYPDGAAQRQSTNKAIRSETRPTGIKSENASLSANEELETPPANGFKQPAVTREFRDRTQSSTLDAALPIAKTDKVTGAKRDRLFVSEGGEGALRLTTTIGQRPEMSEPERTKLKAELQLIAALDEKNAQHIELKERIKQLEALRTKLLAEAANLEGELKLSQSSAPENTGIAPPISTSSTPFAVVASAPLATVSSPAKPEATQASWYKNTYALFLLLVAIAGAVAALIIQQQKKLKNNDGDVSLVEPLPIEPAITPPPAPTEGDPLMEPLTEADIWPEIPEPPSSATVRAIEGAIGPLSGAASSSLLHGDGEDEHDSAVELADIMMSFGRVQGAAQTLADFIRANPKQAVKPWMKLLEVYRVANMRMEFEALTTQMNKTFNVQPVPWDNFEIALRAPESLENLDHIRTQLCALWGQRECQAYLHQLLRDNRQGTRQGFPLAIVDEVLLLLSVLEAQLGPFKPDTHHTNPKPAEPSTHDSGFLTLPVETATIPTPPKGNQALGQVSAVHQEIPPSLTRSLDFDLIDMDMLSKTLHINLDELTEPPPPEEIGK